MQGRTGRLRWLGGLLLVGWSLASAGCFDETELPPVLELTHIEYEWGHEWFYVNFTLRNTLDERVPTPEGITPRIGVLVDEWPGGKEPAWGFTREQGMVPEGGKRNDINIHMTQSPRTDPWPELFLEGSRGQYYAPYFPPQGEIHFPTAFHLKNNYTAAEGYYSISIIAEATRGGPINEDYSMHFTSGCFNHDTPEFYGQGPHGVSCMYLDSTGRNIENPDRTSNTP